MCARRFAPDIKVADLERASPWDYGIDVDPEYEARAQQLGLDSAGLVDLRYECSNEALKITVDNDELGVLLRQHREMQVAAVEDWLREYSTISDLIDNGQ